MNDRLAVESNVVRLRPTEPDDLDFVLRTEGDEEQLPFVRQWTGERHLAALSDPDMAHLILETTDSGRPVGYVILAGLDGPDDSIELLRITVAEKGNGFGREGLKLVKAIAFDRLRAHRLWLDVRDHNVRAKHLYESEGFVEEGVLRECIKVGERFESLIMLSMLEREYRVGASS